VKTSIATGIDGEKFLQFWCPGCDEAHGPIIERTRSERPLWQWNGDRERPTISPSLLIRSGHYAPGHLKNGICWCTYNAEHPADPAPCKCYVCHSFVRDGQIQFLSDCTHHLAGQTVAIPDWPYKDD
jgi:hypothetical protein